MAVVKREYLTRVKKKGFIIGTLLLPVMLVMLFGGVFIFARFFRPESKDLVVVDETGRIYGEFTAMLPDTLRNGEPKYRFREYQPGGKSLEEIRAELNKQVIGKQIDAFLIIPGDVTESRTVTFSGRNMSDYEEQEELQRALSRIVANIRLENKGLPAAVIREEMMLGQVRLQGIQVTEKGEVQSSGISNFLLTYLLSYILMLFIMIYGQTVTRSVIEEKSQRITETIISSIKPVELMLGKMLGICLVGITQLLVIGGFIYAFSVYGDDLLSGAGVQVPELLNAIQNIHFTPVVFVFFMLFFLMGYLLYAALFAAIGAMVNTEDEGQQFLAPVVILNLLSFFIMFSVAKNPDTPSALWTSLFPFFTPVVMFARIAASAPVLPSGAVISVFTTAGAVYLLLLVTAKIYRVGILMYGKKPSLKEAWKWLKY
jgi:ABC-2 type transport system permease protein